MIRFKENIRPEAKLATRKLIDEYDISDRGGIELLLAFAGAYTTELNCQDQIDIDGLTILDRFKQVKVHPLLATMRDARSQRIMALKALNLDVIPTNDGFGRS